MYGRIQNLLKVGGVDKVLDGDKVLLDGAHRDEAEQQGEAASLVVGTGSASTTEGLLANDGAGALVVDVEVTGSVTEQVGALDNVLAAAGKQRAGQAILGSLANQLASGFELSILVHIDGDNRAKDFLDQSLGELVLGQDNSGLDVVSDRVIVLATSNDLALGVLRSKVNVGLDLIKGNLVDNGAGKVLEFMDRALGDLGVFLLQQGNELLRKTLGNIDAGSGGALLTLEFEGTADSLKSSVVQGSLVQVRVQHVVVLATSLTNNARVALVVVDVVTDLLPEHTENVGGAGKVEGCKVGVGNGGATDFLSRARNELDDTSRETSFLKQLIDKVVGVDSRGRRLPDNNVAHQGRSTGQVAGNGGEVEGCDSKHETF